MIAAERLETSTAWPASSRKNFKEIITSLIWKQGDGLNKSGVLESYRRHGFTNNYSCTAEDECPPVSPLILIFSSIKNEIITEREII